MRALTGARTSPNATYADSFPGCATVIPQALTAGANIPAGASQRRLATLFAALAQQAGSTRRKRTNALFWAVAAAVGEPGQDRIPLQAMEAAILPPTGGPEPGPHGDSGVRHRGDEDVEVQRRAVQRLRGALVRAARATVRDLL